MPMRRRLVVVLTWLGCLAFAGPALADWTPTPATALNAPGTFVLSGGLSAASVGGVPYVAWSQITNPAAVTGPVEVDALSGQTFTPVGSGPVGSCAEDPQLAAVAGAPYLACLQTGGEELDVYADSGGQWTQVGPSISVPDGAIVGGLADLGGEPAVAYTTGGEVVVTHFDGSAWSQIGAQLVGVAGDDVYQAALLTDGSSPVVAWGEFTTSNQSVVYADQLNGAAWSPLNGGAALNVTPSGDDSLDGLAMIGTTPYLALDDQPTPGANLINADALTLTGSSFSNTGPPIVSDDGGGFPDAALGTYAGAPIAVTENDEPTGEQLTAQTNGGGGWTQLGSALGVAPLPGQDGEPYATRDVVSGSDGTPYVAFLEQSSTLTHENVYVEAYGSGASPAPVEGVGAPPIVTTSGSVSPSASTLPAVQIQLAAAPAFSRHRRSVRLDSGLLVSCPAAPGSPRCRGSFTARVRVHLPRTRTTPGRAVTVRVHASLAVASGRGRRIAITLSKATLRRLGGLARRLTARGQVTVSAAGPNGATTSLSQALQARLP